MEENKDIINEEEKTEVEETAVEAVKENAEETTEVVEEKAPYDGPSVTVGVRYDYKTLKYYNVFSMVYKRHYPILYLVLAALCIGYIVFTTIAQIIPVIGTENFKASIFLMPGIFVLFAVYSIYLFFNFEKSIDKNLTIHFNSSTEKVTTIQAKITLEGLEITSSKNPTEPYKYDWAYVNQICEIPQYYYLFVGKTPVILSKDPNCVIEGDYETFMEIMNEQIKVKPYKKIDKDIVKKPVTYVHREDLENADEAEVVEENNEATDVVEEEKKDNE